MRPIASRVYPVALAISRVDQCVATAGGGFSLTVLSMTASSMAVVIVRGRPGRGRSRWIPAIPSASYRRFHCSTVARGRSCICAIARLLCPSAAASTMRVRSTSRRSSVRERAQHCSIAAPQPHNLGFVWHEQRYTSLRATSPEIYGS
jgi:hypothetical protein